MKIISILAKTDLLEHFGAVRSDIKTESDKARVSGFTETQKNITSLFFPKQTSFF